MWWSEVGTAGVAETWVATLPGLVRRHAGVLLLLLMRRRRTHGHAGGIVAGGNGGSGGGLLGKVGEGAGRPRGNAHVTAHDLVIPRELVVELFEMRNVVDGCAHTRQTQIEARHRASAPLTRVSHLDALDPRSIGTASLSSSKSWVISFRRLRSASLCETRSSGDLEYGASRMPTPFPPAAASLFADPPEPSSLIELARLSRVDGRSPSPVGLGPKTRDGSDPEASADRSAGAEPRRSGPMLEALCGGKPGGGKP